MLAYDLLQLSALLYLTGGIENPFSLLFLAPIMISAASLSGRSTFGLTLLMIAAATALTFKHYPLPWFPGETLDLPFLYLVGIWTAIVLGAAFTAIYASRVAEEARKLADALAATELVIAREQHLTQLDGLAAAAAHELGTPLATITLVAKDLEKQLGADPAYREDVELLSQETARCRTILGKLTSLGDEFGRHPRRYEPAASARGSGRPAAGFRRGDHDFLRWPRHGAGVEAQSGPSLRSRQSHRKRHRFCEIRGPDHRPMDEQHGESGHRG